MDFKVIPTKQANFDVEEAVHQIAQDSVPSAEKWFRGFWNTALTLEDFPFRFAVIPEAESIGEEYRSCIYHSHRIIYRVDEANKTVYIVRVYHTARLPLKADDLEQNEPKA